MEVSVLDIINSDLAINYNDGLNFFEKIKSVAPSNLTISFEGISILSTLFLNESIGKYTLLHPNSIDSVKFIYPANKDIFSSKVSDVIENAQMGEDYDELVDAAKMAM